MKAIITTDLKNRIVCAAANGSVIAQDLLAAIKNCRDIKQETDKTINYFDSKRKVKSYEDRKTIRVVVTCCRKDVTNRNFPDYGNPQAPYFPENRSEITVKDFAQTFKAVREKAYDDTEWTYFDSAMRLASKVTFRVGTTMGDFIKAYDASNYIGLSESETSTLHGSCMRHEETTRNAADYYVNFAGAKILIGETKEGEVVSRALLWNNMDVNGYDTPINFIDRTYTAFEGFLLTAMRREAVRLGYVWRKTANDYSHKRQFTALVKTTMVMTEGREPAVFEVGEEANFTLVKQVPVKSLHKTGCPYCDTMSYLYYKKDDSLLTICNTEGVSDLGTVVAGLANTGGYGHRYYRICPVCGAVHDSSGTELCNKCSAELYDDTLFFGRVLKVKTATYRGNIVPASILQNGKPTPNFAASIALNRITNSTFSL